MLNRIARAKQATPQIAKEGITMTSRKFSYRIGAALALSVAVGLVIGAFSGAVVQAQQIAPTPPTVSLNPTGGTASAPGQAQFQVLVEGVPQGHYETWTCTALQYTAVAGISTSFSPPNSVVVGPSQQASIPATVTIGGNVTAGTYQLTIRVNCSGYGGIPPAPYLYPFNLTYTLQVTRGGGTNPPPTGGTARMRVLATPNPAQTGQIITFQLINDGPSTLQLPNAAPFRIVNQANQLVFAPGTAQVIVNLAAGETRSWRWDQRTNAGSQVPPGLYTVIVSTVNGEPRELSAQFVIQGTSGGSTPPTPPTPPSNPGSLAVQLSVDRGCGAVYNIGDSLRISYSSSQDAVVTLTLIMPDGSQRIVIANQPVRGGVVNTIQGAVGEPVGTRTLILEAVAGQVRGRAECAFSAGAGSTPVLPLPIGQLQALLTTDRGCQQTGENPIYYVGEQIIVSFQVNGAARAFVTIEDIMDSGERRIVFQGMVPGNQLLQLAGRIVPPTGRETLRLTAQVGQQSVVSECSFVSQ